MSQNEDCVKSFKSQSYVSLFGTSSIDEVRSSILANCKPTTDADQNGKKAAGYAGEFVKKAFKKYEGAVQYFEELIISGFLICIDDIERKEESLTLSGIFGLISTLTQLKRCKVVMIFNEDQLTTSDELILNEYREKLVDLEIAYKPTIEDNLAIIWPNGCGEYISNPFLITSVNNIRVMQLVERSLGYFRKVLLDEYSDVKEKLLERAVILTLLFHAFGKSVNLTDEISMDNFKMDFSSGKRERPEVLSKLSFFPNECDAIILDYLSNGYIDKDSYVAVLESLNEKYRLMSIEESMHEIWRRMWDGFSVKQDQFVAEMINFLELNSSELSLVRVVEATEFLRKLDPEIEVSDFEDRAIESFAVLPGDQVRREVESLELRRRIPEAIAQKVKDRLDLDQADISFQAIFSPFAENGAWNPDNLSCLKTTSEDKLLEWVMTEENLDTVGALKHFISQTAGTEDLESAREKVYAVLKTLVERSPLDRIRAEHISPQLEAESYYPVGSIG